MEKINKRLLFLYAWIGWILLGAVLSIAFSNPYYLTAGVVLSAIMVVPFIQPYTFSTSNGLWSADKKCYYAIKIIHVVGAGIAGVLTFYYRGNILWVVAAALYAAAPYALPLLVFIYQQLTEKTEQQAP